MNALKMNALDALLVLVLFLTVGGYVAWWTSTNDARMDETMDCMTELGQQKPELTERQKYDACVQADSKNR